MQDSQAPVLGQFALLGSRRFLPLFCVQFLNAFNDQCFKTAFIALLTWKIAAEQGIEGQVDFLNQLAAGLFILPFALFAPTAGQIADGVDRAKMMRWVIFSEILLMSLAALAFYLRDVTFLMVLVVATGVQSAFFAPIKYAVLPRYLARGELVAGNGLVVGGTFLAIILGQITGAKIVLAEGGEGWASGIVILVSGLSFLASLFALPVPPLGPAPKVDWVFPRAMVRNIADCARRPEPFFAMMATAWFWFAAATVNTFIPPLARNSLHGTEDVALILLVTFSLGVAIGSVLCNVILRGRITYGPVPIGALGILAGLILMAVGLTNYGDGIDRSGPLLGGFEVLARPDAWPVLAGVGLMALFAGLFNVPLSVIYQVTAPEAERARFVGGSNVIDSIAIVGAAVVSILLLMLGLSRETILVLTGLTGLPVAWMIWRHHRRGPDLRSL